MSSHLYTQNEESRHVGMDTSTVTLVKRMRQELIGILIKWVLICVTLLVGSWMFLTALQFSPPFDCDLLQSSLRVGISRSGLHKMPVSLPFYGHTE